MLASISFWLGLASSSAFAAPQIVMLQRLDFGVLAIRANAVASALTLSPLGATSYGSAFVSIAAAVPGRYRLTGYPAFTDISVSMSASPINLASGVLGETLTVSTAVTNPLVLHTDVNGQVDFNLGATLTTSGSSVLYPDGVYVGHPGLTLNFNVAGVPQFTNHQIDVDVVLRTSLVLTEMEQLSFGKLAVFSSATDQATLKLEPNRQVTIVNAGSAKIVRFGNETPGVFKVTTGAAYAPVTITLPATTIYLTHQSLSPDVARLLATDFVSLPTSANAKLDANGTMEFRLGATLRTEQTAKRYQDGLYSGSYLLDVEY
ncbi:MAG: DUF4402 domain-containing protein [Pseudomonadota bacterium]|nr:DUF4402 domain-containing protein [Pseudomonadota bacterium]